MFLIIVAFSTLTRLTGGTMNLSVEMEDTFFDLEDDVRGRIVGGWVCNIENYPWLASLQKNGRHFCGGSLISQSVILTAAHCVDSKWVWRMKVRLGSKRWSKGGWLFGVANYKVHESYRLSDGAPQDDVALLKLNEIVIFNFKVKPIKLIELMHIENKSTIISAGWGATSEGSDISQLLRCVEVFVIGKNECEKAYATIARGQICATNHYEDTCQGDSGGPLWVDNRQIGIVSYGRGCARREYPGVYTLVAYYRSWIETNMMAINNSDVSEYTQSHTLQPDSSSASGVFTFLSSFICQITLTFTKLIVL